MARHRGAVPVDTNVILEAHRTGSWRAFTGGYAVETAEDYVTETQPDFQRRRPEHRIDQAELRDRLVGTHAVGERERAVLADRSRPLRPNRPGGGGSRLRRDSRHLPHPATGDGHRRLPRRPHGVGRRRDHRRRAARPRVRVDCHVRSRWYLHRVGGVRR